MIEEIRKLITSYSRKGIIIDTNILLLYFIGRFDSDLISRFKRTIQFTIEDYHILLILIEPFEKLITTPNILTEVSNLSGQLGEPARTLYFQFFAESIAEIEEHYIDSATVVEQDQFQKLGLTDTSILELASEQYLVLTDDFRLSQILQTKNVAVINFNHVRVLGWE
jgi:rRNA-processing protein FCF1